MREPWIRKPGRRLKTGSRLNTRDKMEKNDFFEDSEVAEPPREPEKPRYTPDDPRYWEESEDEFEHLKTPPGSHWRFWVWLGISAVAIGVAWAVWLRMFNPYISDAAQYGYIETIEKHGEVFHTYEGVLLPYRNLMDTTRAYTGDFLFSTSDPSVAARLIEAEYAHRPVRLTYKQYHTAMPWRGEQRVIVTAVDSVNARDLLPPDRRPEINRD